MDAKKVITCVAGAFLLSGFLKENHPLVTAIVSIGLGAIACAWEVMIVAYDTNLKEGIVSAKKSAIIMVAAYVIIGAAKLYGSNWVNQESAVITLITAVLLWAAVRSLCRSWPNLWLIPLIAVGIPIAIGIDKISQWRGKPL